MEFISKALFWVANSLLIPDIILLLLLLGRSLLLVGSFYNQFMTKRRNDRLLNDAIRSLTPQGIDTFIPMLPAKDNGLFTTALRNLLSSPISEEYSNFLLGQFENKADKDLALSRILSKMGPVLGLIGTLIAMSPALVGLSSGDIAGMAYNMQVVFATTVVGLVISSVGLITLQFKQRWYADELNKLDYVARILENSTKAKQL